MAAEWTPAINGFFGMIGTLFLAYFAHLAIKMKHHAEMAAQKLDVVQKTTRSTHTFVNSIWGNQLKITALAMRRVADLTKSPVDANIADLAEQALADHQKAQTEVDAQPGTDAEKKGHVVPVAQAGRTIGQAVGDIEGKVEDIHKVVVRDDRSSG